jgi:rhamnose utilization protein RhaD (predicted bifunctional aldolase and dehydrogenase)
MKIVKWIVITLLGLLAVGAFSPLPAVDEARQAYDKMVEESVREADEYLQEKESQKQAADAKAQSKQDSILSEKIEAEVQRIQAEMDTVSNRGLGPTFTQGMKENLLEQLQDKLNRLTSDPEAYFAGQ